MKIRAEIFDDRSAQDLFKASQVSKRKKDYEDDNFSFLNDSKSIDINLELISGFPILDNSKKEDAENAKRLYQSIGKLPIDVAIDPRLWIYLTHYTYKDYTLSRWKTADGQITVDTRFFGFYKFGTDRALSRNSIARLYWGARLTVKEDDPDISFYFKSTESPFVYTNMLFASQDAHQQLTERTLSRNKKLILSILYFMKTEKLVVNKSNIVNICKTVCLQMYNNRLGTNDPEEINTLYNNIIDIDGLDKEES